MFSLQYLSLGYWRVLLSYDRARFRPNNKPLHGRPWDIGVWASGGFSVPGGTQDTKAIDAGVRLGKVLTDGHFGGFLRGNFQYSADLIPVYYVVQPVPAVNAYGAAFNPINLKWNFTSSAQAVPFLELGGGVLFRITWSEQYVSRKFHYARDVRLPILQQPTPCVHCEHTLSAHFQRRRDRTESRSKHSAVSGRNELV